MAMLVHLWQVVTFTVVCLTFLLSLLDGFNRYTTPIYSWRALLVFFAVVASLSTAVWFFIVCRMERTFEEFREGIKDSKDAKTLLGADKSNFESRALAVYDRRRILTALNLLYALVMAGGSLMAVGHAIWLYSWTDDAMGYQKLLDEGFRTAEPATYSFQRKMDMLIWLQHTFFGSVGILSAYFVTSRLYK
jgi:hypothetical protein